MNNKKPLPIGFSNFKNIITEGRLYIDKTRELYEVVTSAPKYSLLTRPRRFGKSLIISTLEEIFLGSKELFKDCWIGRESSYDWVCYPVIRFDFSAFDTTSSRVLAQSLRQYLVNTAAFHGIKISQKDSIADALRTLVVEVSAQKGPVVLLIDEYDYPLTSQLQNPKNMERNAEVLRPFYTVLKSVNEHIRCMFMTGVSKYPQASMFSGLNNVKDISFLPQYAAIAGYTQDEVEQYLQPYINDVASAQKTRESVIHEQMRTWYNGYHFSSSVVSVYNPFSILNYMTDAVCKNYWFMSGTPTFLVDLLRAQKYTEKELESVLTKPTSLEALTFARPSLDVLLYQTGYVTISSVFAGIPGTELYYVNYPNYEVRTSMCQNLWALFTTLAQNEVMGAAAVLRQALDSDDIPLFVRNLQILLADIPYKLHKENEEYYHSLLHIIGCLLGVETQSEVHTSMGRIDLVVHTDRSIFVIELKCKKTPVIALEQIKSQRYYEKFLASQKKIYLVGLAFNFPKKKLSVEWVCEIVE
jgi:hypothetical protein